MPETNAEGLNVSAVEETVQGQAVPPSGAKDWLNLEADTIGNPGAEYKKMGRSPFSRKRQLRRPIVVGADAKLTLDVDVIKDHVDFFGEGIFMSDYQHCGGTGVSKFRPTSVDADGYVVGDDGDMIDGVLVKAQGFENDENNGLKLLADTSTNVKIKTTGLVVENPAPANSVVEVAGIQGIAGDIRLDADGNLTTQGQFNFTQLGLSENQFIYIPHQDEVLDEFAFANADYFGFAQIQTIEATKLTLKRRDWTPAGADAGAGKTIQVFFTRWVRNVPRKHTDEALKSYQFELAYPDLAAGPVDAYIYLRGYMVNMWTWTFSPENKATVQAEFIGMTASDPDTDRLAGPSTALDPVSGLALGTSTDFTRLSVQNADESGLMTDFVDLKIALKNNITPEKALATLGNRFTPLGTFEAEVTAEVFFTTPEIITAVRDNRKVSLATAMRNDDFGVLLDIPSMGVMEAPQKIEHNRLVKITSKISGYEDAFGGYTCGMSVFAHLPVANATTEST